MQTTSAYSSHHQRETVYLPEKRPGFVAWTTAFSYGNGSIGLSFKEALEIKNEKFVQPTLELAESVAAPVSYCSAFFEMEDLVQQRVFLRSDDCGKSFYETGRSYLKEAAFCSAGFPDGRILGFDVPHLNSQKTSWAHHLEVKESLDGGSTWHPVTRLLEGNSIYLWRVRQLKDGTILILASFYGTAWGPEHERITRNTLLPDETYASKLQTFFLATTDGRTFSGPHYVLPGVGAHEYDVVETPDQHLLFITGDVQATPPARQKVRRENGRFINEPIHHIRRGAPPHPDTDPQGGFVPESIVALPSGLLVGSRRNKPYSCSADEGENWFEIDGLPTSLYQPFMLLMPDGKIANFGHFGGDVSFGQKDMFIGMDLFSPPSPPPAAPRLKIKRCLSGSGERYLNRYSAQISLHGQPLAGQTVLFKALPMRPEQPYVKELLPERSAHTVRCLSGQDGWATADFSVYDACGDIHFSYSIQAFFEGDETASLLPCESPSVAEYGLRPRRRNRYPHPAYFAESQLYLSPLLLADIPDALEILHPLCGRPEEEIPTGALPEQLANRLLEAHVLVKKNGFYAWKPSVNATIPLSEVLPMGPGEWFE